MYCLAPRFRQTPGRGERGAYELPSGGAESGRRDGLCGRQSRPYRLQFLLDLFLLFGPLDVFLRDGLVALVPVEDAVDDQPGEHDGEPFAVSRRESEQRGGELRQRVALFGVESAGVGGFGFAGTSSGTSGRKRRRNAL